MGAGQASIWQHRVSGRCYASSVLGPEYPLTMAHPVLGSGLCQDPGKRDEPDSALPGGGVDHQKVSEQQGNSPGNSLGWGWLLPQAKG